MDNLGTQLRKARTDKGWTLEALSERCGLSQGFLSQVERGQSTLSIVSLSSICHALGVPIAELFTVDRPIEPGVPMLTKADAQLHIRIGDSPVSYRYLTNQLPDEPIVELLIAEFPPGAAPCESRHEGEELGYVLAGQITLSIGDAAYSLSAGDSYRVASSQGHAYAAGKRGARILMAVTQRFVDAEPRDARVRGRE